MEQEINEQPIETKLTTEKAILLSIPVVSTFYALFRMLFSLSKHFGHSRRNGFNSKFWKMWFSGVIVGLTSMAIAFFVPAYFIYHLILQNTNANPEILNTVLGLGASIIWGFSAYFLTNLVLKKTKPHTDTKKQSA